MTATEPTPDVSAPRTTLIERLEQETHDVLVVGGGINGAVIAANTSAHGAKVALIDKGDFASMTSSQSSSMVWGGFKYLDGYEFGLVRKLCRSRNELFKCFPSVVKEARFYVVLSRGGRVGRIFLLLGALLYWLLGGLFTRAPRLLSRQTVEREEPSTALPDVIGGVEYSDGYLPDGDARFVFGFVRDARQRGAIAANYVELVDARREGTVWVATVRDGTTGRAFEVRATVMVNACGPLVDLHNERLGTQGEHQHVLSKGVHLIVPRLTQTSRILTFFASDGRPFFVLPIVHRSCIGTTDTPERSVAPRVTDEDRDFVLENINRHLKLPPLAKDAILAERCGVRPLATERSELDDVEADWLQLSRRHVIETDTERNHVAVFGGKLTDCLNVGSEVRDLLADLGVALEPARAWYGEDAEVRARYVARACEIGLDGEAPGALTDRLWRRYQHQALDLLDRIHSDRSLAEEIMPESGYYLVEASHAGQSESVVRLEDFLRRRTQLSLLFTADELETAPGVRRAAELLFGSDAASKMSEYFGGGGNPATLRSSDPPHIAAS